MEYSRTLFIPIAPYAQTIGPITNWDSYIETDLTLFEFYDHDEDGINLRITGHSQYVDEAIEFFLEVIKDYYDFISSFQWDIPQNL